jgi:cell division protein FtsW
VPYRAKRLAGFLNPTGSWQAIQGKYATGSGGLFGVGLGESKQKWGWVPNASTDFIFAILGEELGLVGTACVVFLYGGLAYAGLRVARRMTEPFTRLAAAGITVWIVVQALVNICAVVGLLPITGVPLPLISQGLSSLLVTMAAIGVLLSLARREPGAADDLVVARPKRHQRPPPGVRGPEGRGPGVRGASQGRQGQHGRELRAVGPPGQHGARRYGAGRSEV